MPSLPFTQVDAFADAQQAVPSSNDLHFVVGGGDVGGAAAERIMRSAFEHLDDNLVLLRRGEAKVRRGQGSGPTLTPTLALMGGRRGQALGAPRPC